MSIQVKTFIYDDYCFSANAYIVYDEDNNCFIVDPGIDDLNLIKFINNNNLVLKGVLLTHGHFDHMRGLNLLVSSYPDLKIYIHKVDSASFKNYELNASTMDDKLFSIDVDYIEVDDNTLINGLSEAIKVVHTPYHTLGSVCFLFEKSKMIFTGDSLFQNSIGRFDLINSDFHLIKSSLAKLKCLSDDIIVYPGHGYKTTIGQEKKFNPYFG